MIYARVFTKQCKKDVRRLEKSGYRLGKLERVIDLLASDTPLPPSYKDHRLQGALSSTRECHIAPDWILRYAKEDRLLVLILIAPGTHQDVLGVE